MPEALKPETRNEVDGHPGILNAKDYNVHHREIRAIQQYLIGENGSLSTPGGITALVNDMSDVLSGIESGDFVIMHSGVVRSGESIPIPPDYGYTTTTGEILAAGTTITVDDASAFEFSGYITKINNFGKVVVCEDGAAPGPGDICAVGNKRYDYDWSGSVPPTSVEYIYYGGITETSFVNCLRARLGTTAQDISPSNVPSTALILPGIVSFSLTWTKMTREDLTPISQWMVEHDSMLTANLTWAFEGDPQTLTTANYTAWMTYGLLMRKAQSINLEI